MHFFLSDFLPMLLSGRVNGYTMITQVATTCRKKEKKEHVQKCFVAMKQLSRRGCVVMTAAGN